MKIIDVILASASPRRKELLKLIFDDFSVSAADIPEIVPEGTPSEKVPEILAESKALAIAALNPDSLVIGADTIVLIENKILGKPKNINEATQMLRLLSGKIHKVITGCSVILNGKKHTFSVATEVEFFSLSDKEIEDYVSSLEPYDKAGGYGIQSKGGLFVKAINGDYSNVVGLPVAELNRVIKSIDF